MKLDSKVIDEMKKRVFEANLSLPKLGLVKLTWGNVSEINRDLGIVVIKPSGVAYQTMTKNQMVVTDLEGNLLEENSLKPSSDLATHLVLYQNFQEIGAIVHTHSTNAVIWAQAGRGVPAYGTTHADTFYGKVPCTRALTKEEVMLDYERNTGNVIVETFKNKGLKPMEIPAVLVKEHGPFTWGETPKKAVENSYILEEVCVMAKGTEEVSEAPKAIEQYLLDKHYLRKHGENAYYGQK